MADILRQVVRDRVFLICMLVLLISAVGLQLLPEEIFRKKPVPLRKSFDEFDTSKLGPYRLLQKGDRLPKEIEEALGTKEYATYIFEDTSLPSRSPGKYIHFFVTYYTGSLNQVPHVPEECWAGAGKESKGGGLVNVTVPGIGLKNDQMEVNRLVFRDPRSMSSENESVLYFFSVNGEFIATRTRARLKMADLWVKYSYFSKVELSFISHRGSGQPDADESAKLVGKFLSYVVPVMMNEHLQDWDEVLKWE